MNRKNRLVASITFAVTLLAALAIGGCSDSGTETAATEAAPAPTVKPAGEAPNPAPTPVVEKVAATAKPVAPKVNPAAAASATPPTTKPAVASKSTDIVIEPARLDLGEIPTNDAKSGTIMITNNGTVAHTLLECKTSCGCTTANCQKNKVLEPGESVSVDIKLSGGQRAAKLSKTVTFIVSDQAPIQLPVSGTSVAFVEVTPDRLNPDKHPEGKITLTAIDDVPFTIKSMYPPLIETFDLDPKVKHEIYMSWDALRESGHRTSKVLFNLDHPKAAKAFATLDLRALQGLEPAASPIDTAAQTASRIDLDRLLKDGKTDEVLALLEKGELDMMSIDSSGQSPLVKASRWGNAEVIQAFLDASADISQGDKISRSPLMYACQSKDLESVQVLLDSGASLTDRDQIGNTALCWAAGFGTPEIVLVLLEADAEVEVVGAMTGFTPLIWAAGFGEPESVKMLLDAGADINAADALQRATPLMNAVRTGSIENVIVLLDAGAELEARDAEGKTTLLVAASNAGPDVEKVKLLVDRGADLEATTTNGQNALDLARKRTDLRATEVADYLASVIGAD